MACDREPSYYSDRIAPVQRDGPEQLFLVTLEARPAPGGEWEGVYGGAFVNCWIDADDLRSAERRAVELLGEGGWRPHRFEEWELVTRETYADEVPGEGEPDLREVVERAFADGAACVTHTWAVDAADAEEDD
jgi:hypothetical protein